jgi:hypothetical protein
VFLVFMLTKLSTNVVKAKALRPNGAGFAKLLFGPVTSLRNDQCTIVVKFTYPCINLLAEHHQMPGTGELDHLWQPICN